MTELYAVMGNPVAHSKSPFIHTCFATQTGRQLRYEKILVAPGEFPAAVKDFRARGGQGLNITLPFKREAWELADTKTARAARAGALNTLWFDKDAGLCGDNTDGYGLVRDLIRNLGVQIAGQDVLVLGAGGAARGALGPLLDEVPARLMIANRTESRGQELAALFHEQGGVAACGYPDLVNTAFDLIINATAASLDGVLPPLPEKLLRPGGVCYDMMYREDETVFVRWGQSHGARIAVDGLGMLVEQAAESFRIWHDICPQTDAVIAALRSPGTS